MVKGTTKSQGQKHMADKFYTKPAVAKLCLDSIPDGIDAYDVLIEPSAGNGSFSSLVPNCIAFDQHPEAEGIVEQNWLEYRRDRDTNEKTLVFGNPPFGQQNSLAVKFINQAASFADAVAFILPMSFKKPSVQNRLNPNLHLSFEMDVPNNAFTLNGVDYHVPCVFQVWEYDATRIREKTKILSPAGFQFVKKDTSPCFSVQRVGGRSGFADRNWSAKSEQSNYFISVDKITHGNVDIDVLITSLNQVVYPSRDHSVGPRSISKNDVTVVLNGLLADLANSSTSS